MDHRGSPPAYSGVTTTNPFLRERKKYCGQAAGDGNSIVDEAGVEAIFGGGFTAAAGLLRGAGKL
jgi:hypothetical protein